METLTPIEQKALPKLTPPKLFRVGIRGRNLVCLDCLPKVLADQFNYQPPDDFVLAIRLGRGYEVVSEPAPREIIEASGLKAAKLLHSTCELAHSIDWLVVPADSNSG